MGTQKWGRLMPNIPALVTLVIYSIILFGVGLWAAQRAKTQEDFLLGGRNLGPWVAGLAYAASNSSAWTMLGFSGFIYLVGPSGLWMIPGTILGKAVVWLGAGHVLRNDSRDRNLLTMTDFLTQFASPVTARWIRVLASLFIAFCFSFYVAAQFQGAGIAIDDVFRIGTTAGILIGAFGSTPNGILATTAPWVGAAIAMAVIGRAGQMKEQGPDPLIGRPSRAGSDDT